MKRNYKIHICSALLGISMLTSCSEQLTITPYDGLTSTQVVNTPEGLKAATLGNYAILKDGNYIRSYHLMAEFPSDNVSLSGTTADPLYFSYNYNHIKNSALATNFYAKSYQALYGANVIIELLQEGQSADLNQVLGENYFLRALLHFNLANIFARPYATDAGASPGIIIAKATAAVPNTPRSSVKDVYSSIIQDLEKSISLMTIAKNNNFASKEVAYAMLSRVYLYMEDNAKAIEYANKVIDSNRYTLVSTANLPKYYTTVPETNSETIFAVRHTIKDNRGYSSIGAMYLADGEGWGEMYASESYRNLINKFPNDVRRSFITPVYEKNADGSNKTDAAGNPILAARNGYPKYYINKLSYQEGYSMLSSPVLFRLAETYLIRAEAYAKTGKTAEALEDVNLIRKRAGLSGNQLYSAANMMGHATVLDVVLEEAHLELAWECLRKYDVFRNKRTMVRNYPGTHLIGGAIKQEIPYTHPRVVHYLPEAQMVLNTALVQNPD
jgi:tetratricopeptide (TPR) repeat protein